MRREPMTFASYIESQSSSLATSIRSRPRAPPAALTSTRHSGTAEQNRCTESGSVTSRGAARPPSSSASTCRRSSRRAPTTRSNPSADSRRAVAIPIPLLAPVTTAVPRLMRVSIAGFGPPV
jgi:hypothetical protein